VERYLLRRYAKLTVMFLAAAAGGCLGLAMLPYSTSLIEWVDEAEVLRPPGETFRVGALTWDMGRYRSAVELQAFRDAFGPTCAGHVGLAAARCVAEVLTAKSPSGTPTVEFVDASFDPPTALRKHLAGAPGHCTTRSAMTATGLLSIGIAARVAQLLPLEVRGHNVVEVWDAKHGWLLFDPHFDSSYMLGDSFVSAVQLSRINEGLRWRRPNERQPNPNLFAGATISYPEPWLYTRVGGRCAPWPFRACFAQFGPEQFRYGPAQRLALGSAALFGMAAALCALRLLVLWRSRVPQ
jgi:hypothetical protein